MQQRLHVFLAHAGIASRRKAEELIEHGNVKVNGATVKTQGMQIDPATDKVMVDGKLVTPEEKLVYFLMNKSKGVVSTVTDPDQKRTVIDVFRRWWKHEKGEQPLPRVYPVGRLDEGSEGLLLLTNDGDLAYKLTHPKFEVAKTYHILLQGSPSNTALNKLAKGINLKEGRAIADDIQILKHEEGNTWISMTIHQGMTHQIRRMCDRVGLSIMRLVRMQMGEYELGKIPTGLVQEIFKPQ